MSEQAKKAKQIIIDEIKEKLDGAQSAVLVDYMGITVAQADAMRKKFREADVDYSVYKNTLMKRAVEGTEFEKLSDCMAGPSAIAISKNREGVHRRVQEDGIQGWRCRRRVLRSGWYPEDRQHSVQRGPRCQVHGKHPVAGWQVRQNTGCDL